MTDGDRRGRYLTGICLFAYHFDAFVEVAVPKSKQGTLGKHRTSCHKPSGYRACTVRGDGPSTATEKGFEITSCSRSNVIGTGSADRCRLAGSNRRQTGFSQAFVPIVDRKRSAVDLDLASPNWGRTHIIRSIRTSAERAAPRP
jgi:hypothetical protein